jgi:hypothetical protein
MKMNYSYNEMKRAFECGRNFQLTGENNFQELIEEMNQSLPQADVSGRSEQLKCQCKKAQFTRTVDAYFNCLCGRCGKAL